MNEKGMKIVVELFNDEQVLLRNVTKVGSSIPFGEKQEHVVFCSSYFPDDCAVFDHKDIGMIWMEPEEEIQSYFRLDAQETI